MNVYTLDHFLVFTTVVEQGGFAAAARKLGRAQSAITYAIHGLEEQSGLVLFDRSGYRPALTAAGQALLPWVRRLITDLDDYRHRAESIASGVEACLSVAVDPFVPLSRLSQVLKALHENYPTVRIQLVTETPEQTKERVRAGGAQLGVGMIMPTAPLGAEFQAGHWLDYELVAVAASTHPLTRLAVPISADELRGHMQLVWRPAAFNHPDRGVHALDSWYVSDLAAKLHLLRAGIGWGSLPDHLAADDIQDGRLVKLELESWDGSDRMPSFSFSVFWRKNTVFGPAARYLIDIFLTI